MSSSDTHLATTILDPLCAPQTQYQSKFYSKYSISCKESIIGMPLETMWSFHIEIRPHLAGHFRKEKNKDDRSTWSSRCSVQYSQEIFSNETVAQKVTELQIFKMWEKTEWKIFSISHGLLSAIGERVSRTFACTQYSGFGTFTYQQPKYLIWVHVYSSPQKQVRKLVCCHNQPVHWYFSSICTTGTTGTTPSSDSRINF